MRGTDLPRKGGGAVPSLYGLDLDFFQLYDNFPKDTELALDMTLLKLHNRLTAWQERHENGEEYSPSARPSFAAPKATS